MRAISPITSPGAKLPTPWITTTGATGASGGNGATAGPGPASALARGTVDSPSSGRRSECGASFSAGFMAAAPSSARLLFA
jgi:hypothetical protein